MRVLALLHRWTGGMLGVLLAMLGLTGTILIHKDAWLRWTLPHAADPPLRSDAALASLVTRLFAGPDRPRMIVLADDRFGLDQLSYAGGRGAYIDQTGAIVAQWQTIRDRPELWLFDLHAHLLCGDVGKAIVGTMGLIGIGFVATGALLWWRTRRTFALRLWPKRVSRPAILRHHRDLGIVAAPLLLISFTTGALLVFRPMTILFGSDAPAIISRTLAPPPARAVEIADRLDWPGMIGTVRARFPQAEIRSISLPRGRQSGLITLRMRQPEEWLSSGRTMAWFTADTGRLIAARDARVAPSAAAAFNLLFPIHAAEVGGLAYRASMTASGLALTLLGTLTVWTFWFRRLPASKRANLYLQRAPRLKEPLWSMKSADE